ncbi:MAG TPA: thioesterase family protein [Acidobacteriota bacterium]|nr:thioesterase family protein [Acidobacteriota bacterium]
MALDLIRTIYEEKIPFHEILGLRITAAGQGSASLEFDFQERLVGNYRTQALHGGVIAAVLDVVGSAAVLTSFTPQRPPRGLGTIDLRTDYLMPARGSSFRASAEVLRPGRSVAVTRMELRNQDDELLAVATATYRVSLSASGGHDIMQGWLQD